MNTMLSILGAALVVFVFLGDVRRVRRPELLPRHWGPVLERRVRRYRPMTGWGTFSRASAL